MRVNMADLAQRRGLAMDVVNLILQRLGLAELLPQTGSDRIDRVALHPVAGPLLLALLLFVVFLGA